MPIIVQAIGVFVAPAKTATKPIPANKGMGKGINHMSTFPRVAPIKNKGVTSPPLNPAPKVKEVSISFRKKS